MLSEIFQLNKGFTLMEVLVAIFLITFGIGGTIVLVNQTIVYSQINHSKLIAAYLAQEGIEIVRNIRDSNFLKIHKGMEGSWDDGLTGCGGGCYNFDYRSEIIPDNTNCSGKTYLKLEDGFYKCSLEANPQKLQRKVTITSETDVLKVSVEVSWQERGRRHQVTAQENLYKWQ